jgi:shikimate kinase
MGSGKTIVGALVAQRAGAAFHDLDHMIEDAAGMAISDIFATKNEAAFRVIESETLPRVLEPGSVAALGGGTTMDDRNWKLIRERAMTVYLDASIDTIWDRISGLGTRPLAMGRSRDEVAALLAQRRPRYEEADRKVDADRPLEAIAAEVLGLWSG